MTIQYQGVWTLPVAARLQSTQQWATDPLYRNTTLLLQADNAPGGAQNNTFIDSSSNNFTITRNGNTTQGTFTPFSLQPGAWSTFFPGASSLIVPAGSAFAYGTGAFTVEAWINPYTYQAGLSTGGQIITQTTSGQNYFTVGIGGSGEFGFTFGSGAGTNILTAPGSIPLGRWTHIAVVREGTGASQLKLYVNGFLLQSGTCSFDFTNTTYNPTVGNYTHDSTQLPFGGYISNLRVVKGVAVYTGNFTPSSLPLTATQSAGINTAAITGTQTSLLTAQSNRFLDNSVANSGGGWTVTLGGTPSVQAFSPFAPQYQWTAPVIGGSGYFDGTGDYLSNAANTIIPSTGDFTFETWVYPTQVSTLQYLVSTTSTNTGNKFHLYINASAFVGVQTGSSFRDSSTTKVVANAWNHVACTRTGSTYALFVNGVLQTISGSGTMASTLDVAPTQIGSRDAGTSPITGYLSSTRVSNSVLYTVTFTLPTAPFTTGTNLLLNFTNAGIVDGTMKNNLETVGNAQVSTSIVKYGTGSMAFDGSGDSLDINNTQLGIFSSGDFTIECWIYFNALPGSGSNSQIIDFRGFGVGTNVAPCLSLYNASGTYNIRFESGSSVIADRSVSVSTGIWYHLAAVRSNGNVSIYWNGTISGTAFSVTTNYSTGYPVRIGAYTSSVSVLNGYIDDLRVTKGIARYTANFTPPTVALPRQ